MKKITILSTILFCLLITLSCSKKDKTNTTKQPQMSGPNVARLSEFPFNADKDLPPDIDSLTIKRTAEPRVVRPGEVSAYLGGSADRYLQYDFVGLVATKYTVAGTTVFVEIAEFAEPEDAYGHYAILRPDGIAASKLGVESFVMGSTKYFVRGQYVVTLSVENDFNNNMKAVDLLAEEINNRITGKTSLPPFFLMFPYRDKIIPSTKYYHYNYLGIPRLDKVYTTDYVLEGDTMTLFLTMDKGGEQYLKLESFANSMGNRTASPMAFDFDGGFGLAFEHPQYGKIVAGLVKKKLVGVVGYNAVTMERFASMWVKGLKM